MPKIPEQIVDLVRSHHRQLLALDRRARSAVSRRFEQAAERVRQRIADLDPAEFEAQRARITLLLAEVTQAETEGELEQLLESVMSGGFELAPGHTANELVGWLEHYGHEARPIDLAAVAELSDEILIERIPRSLEIWGPQIAERVRDELAVGATSRQFADQAVEGVTRAIDSERWKAERIVRTELLEAYNTSHHASLEYAQEEAGLGDEIAKSCIATFDARTDEDSYPVHGQVRALDEDFVDGDGRRYEHPPGRPNDREKEIPWLTSTGADILSREEGISAAEAAKEEEAQRREAGVERRRRARQRARAAARRAARGETFEERRSQLVRSWTTSSNSNRAIEMKTAVSEHFNAGAGIVYSRRANLPDLDPADVAQTAGDLKRIYRGTQRQFQLDGTQTVTLYRGLKSPVADVGALEGWTTDLETAQKFGTYTVIKEEVDVRRVLWHHNAPGWQNGRYGEQFEYLVMPEAPRPDFREEDFEIGFFAASEIDERPIRSDHWGIYATPGTEDEPPGAELYHIPTQQRVIGGSFTKGQLTEAAGELDMHLDLDGRIVDEATLFDDAASFARYQANNRVDGFPDYSDVTGYNDLGGVEFPIINADVDPGPATTWSRRVARVAQEGVNGEFNVIEAKGYTRRNFFIYKTASSYNNANGYEVADWHIVHLPTGVELHSGVAMRVGQGQQGVGMEIGGWRKGEFDRIADELEPFLDDDGNVEDVDGWLERITELERETAPGFDAADFLGDDFDPADWHNNPITTRVRPRYESKTRGDELDPLPWETQGPTFDELDDEGDDETFEFETEEVPF